MSEHSITVDGIKYEIHPDTVQTFFTNVLEARTGEPKVFTLYGEGGNAHFVFVGPSTAVSITTTPDIAKSINEVTGGADFSPEG